MLTRKFLASKGLEADVIDEIIQAHTDTVNGLKDKMDDFDKYKKDSEELGKVKKELENLKEEVAKNGGKDYEKLKAEFEAYKTEVENKAVRDKKEAAFKEILKDAGVPEKHYAKVIKYSDIDSLELDENGKIKTAKEVLKAIKEEWSDHIPTDSKKGAGVDNPPGNNGGKSMSKEEIMKIEDTKERQAAWKKYFEENGNGGN